MGEMKSVCPLTRKWVILLALAVLGLSPASANAAITSATYQVSASADDGYAWGATQQDIIAGYLMIGDGRDYAAPFYMSAMRFSSVGIPRRAAIIEAHLKISSISEGNRGQIYGTIQAEATDDAADFGSRYIAAANKTTAVANWDHKFAWDKNTWQISPDISSLVQEVINRPGWNSGNTLAVFYSTRTDSDKSRMFGSFDLSPGTAAILEITYETYSISGYITTSGGTPADGTTVSAGVNIEATTTDGSGYYELQVPPGWSGTVTPGKTNWGFNPQSKSYTNVNADQTNQNYTAFQPNISGYIRDGSGTGVAAVTVSANNGGTSDATDASGYYELTVPYNWSGTVTTSKAGWHIAPPSWSYSNVIADQTNQNYTAFQPKISGYVTHDGGTGFAGATVSADNGGGSDTTDSSGYYELVVPYEWSGAVTPNKAGWGFSPPSRSYGNVVADQQNDDYTAFQPKISGYVTHDGGTGLAGVTVSADSTGSDTTDSNGYYEFVVPYEWSGTITVNALGWQFSPPSYAYNNVIADQPNQNFSAVYVGVTVKKDGTGDFTTIQAAINAVVDGHTIVVSPGDYYESIHFAGKDIVLRSTEPNDPNIVNSTQIYCGLNCSVVTFSGTETSDCILWGFKITAGDSYYGGGIRGNNTKATIKKCMIVNNKAMYGAGLFECDGLITGCFISRNWTTEQGGGLYNCDGTIENCTIQGNLYSYEPKGLGLTGCDGTINNCIIWEHGGQPLYSCSIPSYSCIRSWTGGGIGNISSDPLLASDGYHLQPNSPCIEAGDPSYIDTNETDIDGDPRIVGRIDIGTDEFYVREGPYMSARPVDFYFEALEDRVNPEPQILRLFNFGSNAYNYLVQSNSEWLQAAPENGQLNTGEQASVSLAVDINGLAAGDYSESLTIASDSALNSPQVVDVNLHIIGPALSISPTEFNFQASKETLIPADQILSIVNQTGGGTLNWQITLPPDCNWISANPPAGQSIGEVDEVILNVDVSEVDYGSYSCQFTVSDPNATNSPQTVTINLDVLRPMISVSPSFLWPEVEKGSPNPTEATLSIQNTGYDTLNWQITIPSNCSWLSANPMTGQSPGEVNEVIISADPNGLDVGFYECELTISDPDAANSPRTVWVLLHVFIPGELHVPAEYPTIRKAIHEAFDGDEVIVHPGTYTGPDNVGISFWGKAITIRSINPADPDIVAATIIDAGGFEEQYWGPVFYFQEEGPDSVLDGLTITGGISEKYGGGGIACYSSSPTIRNCIIKDCLGGGIGLFESSNATITNCIIRNNYFSPEFQFGGGSGIMIWSREVPVGHTVVRISNCVISNNSAIWGGGIDCWANDAIISNCTITGNVSLNYYWGYPQEPTVGGGILIDTCSVTVNNCIVWDNVADMGPEIAIIGDVILDHGPSPSRVTVSYSDVHGGEEGVYITDWPWEPPIDPNLIDPNTLTWGEGNIDINPLFVRDPNDGGDGWFDNYETVDIDESANNDYGDLHLRWASPAINAGDPNFVVDPNEKDIDAEPRVMGPRVDIGADEVGLKQADFTRNGLINLEDLAVLGRSWASSQEHKSWYLLCDLFEDGLIDRSDLAEFLDDWLWQASWYEP